MPSVHNVEIPEGFRNASRFSDRAAQTHLHGIQLARLVWLGRVKGYIVICEFDLISEILSQIYFIEFYLPPFFSHNIAPTE